MIHRISYTVVSGYEPEHVRKWQEGLMTRELRMERREER